MTIIIGAGSEVVLKSPSVDLVVETPDERDVVLVPMRGPAGASGGGLEHHQLLPMATWTIAHDLGRLPGVEVYLSGVLVLADVWADATTAVITFPSPVAGIAVLT